MSVVDETCINANYSAPISVRNGRTDIKLYPILSQYRAAARVAEFNWRVGSENFSASDVECRKNLVCIPAAPYESPVLFPARSVRIHM